MAMLITLASMLVYVHYKPFVDEDDDRLSLVAQLMTFLTMFAGLLMKVGTTTQDGYNLNALGAFLLVTNIAVLLYASFISLQKMKSKRNDSKPSAKPAIVPKVQDSSPPPHNVVGSGAAYTITTPSPQ